MLTRIAYFALFKESSLDTWQSRIVHYPSWTFLVAIESYCEENVLHAFPFSFQRRRRPHSRSPPLVSPAEHTLTD